MDSRALPSSHDTVGDVLVDWFARAARDLPWRRPDTDPWAVLVSEVMLQQTQVVRVAAVWPDFMARFPTPEAMSGATAGESRRFFTS